MVAFPQRKLRFGWRFDNPTLSAHGFGILGDRARRPIVGGRPGARTPIPLDG